MKHLFLIVVTILLLSTPAICGELLWPIDCIPGKTCLGNIGYPDIDSDGRAFNCGNPGYFGHQGTDISAGKGTEVYAALGGYVLWVFDGKYDECPSSHPDCSAPPEGWFEPGQSYGYRVCTPLGPYCQDGSGSCFWCFDGGNVVVIKHPQNSQIFATRYDHLKKNSITVTVGERVRKGQKIAEVASAGHSTGPHLHFEVWGSGYYQLADPWAGKCGPSLTAPLWLGGNRPWEVTPPEETDKTLIPIYLLLQDW